MAGPRSEPPMPMLTTLRMRRPVNPFQAPPRTRVVKSAIRSSTACTGGTTFTPSPRARSPAWRPQAPWGPAAFLGAVDLSAGEHGGAGGRHALALGELQQQ